MVGIASAATHAYRDKGIALLRNQNIKSGYLDDTDVLYVDPAYEYQFKNKRLKQGDLLTARTGYPGTTCVVPEKYDSVQSFTTLIIRPYRDVMDSFFLCFYINSEHGQGFFEQSQIGGAQKNVNAGSLQQMPIPVLPLPEQRAIAVALSDVDALITKLDQLIAKKRDLKQAAMQQLLTGKTRLPGFEGKWEVKELGELLSYEQPTNYLVGSSKYNGNNNVPVLTAGKTFILGYTSETYGVFKDLPVIIFDDFTTDSKYVTFPFKAKSSAMKILKPQNPSVNLKIIFDIIQLIKFKIGDHKRYWISEYQKLEVKIPTAAEQTAIASVLSDMDAEITALEARRDKTRSLKQGMMQELLTGRIRLI
ncbi:restriction endonuclease subunit S, partial [Candidatus Magnetaquicoccus inordinatus]|uniref:restriction endonuclease subunit S n=1 Tax=Candidatus Magnetaquicoccus inordinatus TaxID=2496818 RepID=UPI00102B94D0